MTNQFAHIYLNSLLSNSCSNGSRLSYGAKNPISFMALHYMYVEYFAICNVYLHVCYIN